MGGKVIDGRAFFPGCRCKEREEEGLWSGGVQQRCHAVSLVGADERPWIDRLSLLLKESDGGVLRSIQALKEELPGLDAAHRQFRGVSSRSFAQWARDNERACYRLMLLHSFWVRSPLDWREDELSPGRSMARHLLARYPVPPALLSSFEDGEGRASSPWIAWTVLMGRGSSLRKAVVRYGWEIPARLPGLLFAAPSHLSAEQAVMWAEVQRLGGNDSLSTLVAASGWIPRDAWNRRADPLSWDALGQVVGWFLRNGEGLDDLQKQLVLEWARHRHSEAEAGGGRAASWHRRTAAHALARSAAYQQMLVRSGQAQEARTWARRGWDWSMDMDGHAWVMRELCSTGELANEGRAMWHCVASYADRCASGGSAVFSLSRDGDRVATVEVDPATVRLRQAKGMHNRSCDALTQGVVSRWLDEISNRPLSPAK